MKTFFLCALSALFYSSAFAQNTSLLKDYNGDGAVSYLGFGDSLTYGIGDKGNPLDEGKDEIRDIKGKPSGYVSRLVSLLGISGENAGVPGEVFIEKGSQRLPKVLATSKADIVGFLVGANDAIFRLSGSRYERALQRALNLARIFKKQAVLITPLSPCCDRESLRPFIQGYDSINVDLASVNQVPLVKLNDAWDQVCPPGSVCRLYNLPEGLHPNARGYNLIFQTVAATLLGIDIFSPQGPQLLADAIGIDRNDIELK